MEYGKKWKSYWKQFLNENMLENYVSEMDQVDEELGNESRIEEICYKIYQDYQTSWQAYLEEIRIDFIKKLEEFESVHLLSGRVKTLDSLLGKVIIKRYKSLPDKHSAYAKINGINYKDIITDLIGVRIILNFRGNWKEIHEEILGEFPYEKELFGDDKDAGMTLPHSEKDRLAQKPKVYYAKGDDISEYQSYGLSTQLRENGYRSIHYIISYKGVYIELQVRTIYDEAWSDCDHRYVYKQDQNKSYSALKDMSSILCRMTNLSNDWGDIMKYVFDTQSCEDTGQGTWFAEPLMIKQLDEAQERLKDICHQVDKFRSNIQHRTVEEGL